MGSCIDLLEIISPKTREAVCSKIASCGNIRSHYGTLPTPCFFHLSGARIFFYESSFIRAARFLSPGVTSRTFYSMTRCVGMGLLRPDVCALYVIKGIQFELYISPFNDEGG